MVANELYQIFCEKQHPLQLGLRSKQASYGWAAEGTGPDSWSTYTCEDPRNAHRKGFAMPSKMPTSLTTSPLNSILSQPGLGHNTSPSQDFPHENFNSRKKITKELADDTEYFL